MTHQALADEVECPNCGHRLFGLDALFDMRFAAILVPMSYAAMRKYLSRHREEFTPLYRLSGRAHRRVRVVSGAEIIRIRRKVLRGGPIPPLRLLKTLAGAMRQARQKAADPGPEKPVVLGPDWLEAVRQSTAAKERGKND